MRNQSNHGKAVVGAVAIAAIVLSGPANAVSSAFSASGANHRSALHPSSAPSLGGNYILRAVPGRLDALTRDAQAAGATVTRRLGLINAIAVNATAKSVRAMARSSSLQSISGDVEVAKFASRAANQTPTTTSPLIAISPITVPPVTLPPVTIVPTTAAPTTTVAPPANEITAVRNDLGSMYSINHEIRSDELWSNGYTGAGVDIAVIDTGVAPVPGLAGKIINGPDLSLDHPYEAVQGLDGFGHGTHMASIAAGVDPGTKSLSDPSKFVGVAPGSRIVNVKVGAFDGSVDVSQVIAGIDWVVQHKNDNGMNIKVLNLSYGTESTNNFFDDPLSWAAEAAWRSGIIVVAAAGNDGGKSRVLSPAYNPVIIGVGAVDQTVQPLSPASFSNTNLLLKPDLWAPGSHVLGLRAPNSLIDTLYPGARVGTRLFRGSGTSQATAIVSGAAALLVQANPSATPTQIRNALRRSGEDVNGKITSFINVQRADALLKTGTVLGLLPKQLGTPGTGPIQGSRGPAVLYFNGVALSGERDIFGADWNSSTIAAATSSGTAWSGGSFNGNAWAGNGWAGNAWATGAWSANSWAGNAWAGNAWASGVWAGNAWAGNAWAGNGWAGNGWAGNGWAGNGWAGNGWAGNVWAGNGWAGNGWQ